MSRWRSACREAGRGRTPADVGRFHFGRVNVRVILEHVDDLRAMLEKRPDEGLGFEEEPDP
jgi:hypothetical protein